MSLRFRVLGSGSGGNATLVEGGGARVLLDAGLGPRQLAERLESSGVDPASLDAVFVSHEHGDHARGAAAFSAKWGVPLALTRGTFRAAGFAAGEAAGLGGDRPRRDRAPSAASRSGRWRSPTTPPRPSPSWCPPAPRRSATRRTSGTWAAGLVEALRGCDAVLVESNYDPAMLRDGPYPWSLKERILGPFGHLSNEDAARLLERGLGEACRTVVLAHLSQKNNHPELALRTAEESLARAGRRDVAWPSPRRAARAG